MPSRCRRRGACQRAVQNRHIAVERAQASRSRAVSICTLAGALGFLRPLLGCARGSYYTRVDRSHKRSCHGDERRRYRWRRCAVARKEPMVTQHQDPTGRLIGSPGVRNSRSPLLRAGAVSVFISAFSYVGEAREPKIETFATRRVRQFRFNRSLSHPGASLSGCPDGTPCWLAEPLASARWPFQPRSALRQGRCGLQSHPLSPRSVDANQLSAIEAGRPPSLSLACGLAR